MSRALVACLLAACSSAGGADGGVDAQVADAHVAVDARLDDAGADAGSDAFVPPLGDRERLLASYLTFLQASPDAVQSNGLRGRDLSNVCDLWAGLDPSARAVFLTLCERLEGSRLRDGSSMLSHITALHRVVGGDGASASDPGSCGGGENNRMIMSIDTALRAALLAANDRGGAEPFDIADIPSGGKWRDSHDLGGPHGPFDRSDETEDGAPRAQVHYFADPSSSVANAPLGRTDLEALVDPDAMEMDQDYDCPHSSNPLCDYTFYGPLCVPQATRSGVEIYADNYGVIDLAWAPSCR